MLKYKICNKSDIIKDSLILVIAWLGDDLGQVGLL